MKCLKLHLIFFKKKKIICIRAVFSLAFDSPRFPEISLCVSCHSESSVTLHGVQQNRKSASLSRDLIKTNAIWNNGTEFFFPEFKLKFKKNPKGHLTPGDIF